MFEMHETPESSNIRSIGWSPMGNVLRVQFKAKKEGTADSIYDYEDFPREKFDEFLRAPSKGIWFQSNVRGKYQTRKIQ